MFLENLVFKLPTELRSTKVVVSIHTLILTMTNWA